MTGNPNGHRDERLGAALLELEVPDHGPDFAEELRARLEPGRAARGERFGLLRRRRLWLGAAAAAALVAVVFLAIRLPGSSAVATAAEVRAAVTEALANVESLRGTLVARTADDSTGSYVEDRWSFSVTGNGDFRITSRRFGTDLAYDASENTERYSDAPAGSFVVTTGLPTGWPDTSAPDWVLRLALGSVVRAFAERGDPRVEEIEYRGRPAWLLRAAVEPAPGETERGADERRVTIDRATGIPVRDVLLLEGRMITESRIDDLEVDPSLEAGAFTIEPTPEQEIVRRKEPFRRVSLRRAGEIAGYAPLVPGWLPSGFRLAEVVAADSAAATGGDGRENPRSRGVVAASYRRGLELVVVSTRLVGPDPSRWSDPVPILGPGPTTEPRRVTFGGGALAGRRGSLVLDPESVPHVWALTDRLVVTVAGYVRPAELVRIAESLAADDARARGA